VAWCPFPLFRPLGLVISYIVINTGLLFISLFVALCVKLDPSTHNGNAFSFSLKPGCDNTLVADIVDYFTNVSKISGPIESTSLVTWIAMNLGYSDFGCIEGDVPILGLHFVHAHILCEEPDYSLSMLYGHMAIRLPNPALRLYSCESFTLQGKIARLSIGIKW
jgi:hypothetical protein